MAYQVNKFNGQLLVSVDDGTLDTSTDIRFVGKNYAGYGEVQNENFLHLLEHFSNTTAPPKPQVGQIWYDSANKKIKFYAGTGQGENGWKTASGATVKSTPPGGVVSGDFWFNSETQQLHIWAGDEYVLVGPPDVPAYGTSAAVGQVVQDNVGSPQSIVKIISGGDTVAIVSRSEFVLGSVNPITGFDRIKKGITLIKTEESEDGVTSDDHYFWGTASNSDKLGGLDADNYLKITDTVFTSQIGFKDPGFYVGDDKDLLVYVETKDPIFDSTGGNPLRDDDQVVIEQATYGNPITIRLKTTETTKRNVLKIRSSGVYPGVNGAVSLGSTTYKWSSVVAETFTGNVTGNLTGNTLGGYHKGNLLSSSSAIAFDHENRIFYGQLGTETQRALVYGDVVGDVTGNSTSSSTLGSYAPSLTATASTVVVRDSSADVTARYFIGIANKSSTMLVSSTATDTDETYRSATTSVPSGVNKKSIAARDSDGNISAIVFDGTATAARYADLAEKYLPDAEYEPGTVMVVGGEKEVTASSWGQRAIGVVSTNPAFMMNKDLEGGVYVALKGRVPVKVSGRVKKGDRLVAGNNGLAVAAVPHANDVFAIALADGDNDTVEAVIL